ncbi:MAG: hypothetical protein Q9210_005574 [Variospora velana]
MADGVRPDHDSVQDILKSSHASWLSYASNSDFRYPADLRSLLGRVPAFPRNSSQVKEQSSALKYHQSFSTLRISGTSSWRTSLGECELPPKILHHDLPCGFTNSVACHFSTSCPSVNWLTSQEDGEDTDKGHITLLILAWAYILSARWVELQGPLTRLAYSPGGREWQKANLSSEAIEIHVGEASEQSIRWWAALLAPGQGWRAEIDSRAEVFQSPWSVYNVSSQRFVVREEDIGRIATNGRDIPPSAEEALTHLRQYCELHAIGEQYTAALAAALFFPWKNSENPSIALPLPKPRQSPSAAKNRPSPRSIYIDGSTQSQDHQLPYLMTLSCNVRGLRALLSGSFFESGVPCNLVGPYLQPIFAIIDPLLARNDLRKLATIMGRRQPNIAYLWLGAIVMGLYSSVLRSVRSGLFSMEPHAAAWTGTVHSFINGLPQRTNNTTEDEITRADECRLLYLTASENHQRYPVSPWPPFGAIPLAQTDIEVRKHAACTGHILHYTSWHWDTDDGGSYEDLGYDPTVAPVYPQRATNCCADLAASYQAGDCLTDELASEVATRSIFGWLRVDGFPSTEKHIFTHDWFVDTGSSSEDSLCDDGDTSTTELSDVEAWLDNLEI